MTDQTPPTEEEQEQAPEQMEEQESMQYPGHQDPPDVKEAHDA